MTGPLSVPQRLGKYEILRRLAFGGMAEVLLARAPGAAHDVVIKRVLPQYATNEEFVAMFRDEAELTAELHHENIAEVIEHGEDDGRFFLVLEYVDGPSLASILAALRREKERLGIGETRHIATSVALALEYAHGRQIVHRDVTPSNILVANDGRVKLADFGIAKARTSGALVLKGKLAYMAPETVLAGAADARSDVFALGAVMWEMLTNRTAFAAETEAETIVRVTSETPHPPRSFNKSVPEALDDLVMRMLDRAPERRPRRALDVANALAKLPASRASQASSPAEALERRLSGLFYKGPTSSQLRAREVTRPSTRPRVLVIESKVTRALVKASLGQRFVVSEATRAKDARAILSLELPDALICAHTLEGEHGLDLCRWMRTVPALARVPVILIAAEVDDALCLDAVKAGAQAVLPKRFDPDRLAGTVHRLIEEAKA